MSVLSRLRDATPDAPPTVGQGLVAIGFVVAGVLHFTHTKRYEAIMPRSFPAHAESVYASGVAEIAGGLGVLLPATRRYAGWGLIALLVAVFPANVNMAVNPDEKGWRDIPDALLWLRLPLQPLIGYAVWRVTQRR